MSTETSGRPETKGGPRLLVVARDAQARRALAAALEGQFAVDARAPVDLARSAEWVDAACAVAWLDEEQGEAGIEELRPLRTASAGRALVIVVQRGSEEFTSRAMAVLAPARALSHPVSPALLRFCVEGVLSTTTHGEGARGGHRPAAALLGVSAAIRDVTEQIRRVAGTRSPVLILGETGTGKELVARAVHAQSPRASRAFVAVNCGGLPATLLESELFGHTKGAFTGADRSRRGLFDEADGGTLFLDEIGDMPSELQVKLLRVLESGEVRQIGSTGVRQVDVRIVSATHRDLEAAIEAGTFRQDLYYRINTVVIYIPPLRRRRVDIPFLAQHFAEELGVANARRITLDEGFIESISQRDFPGNVRELRNAVERAIALAMPGERVREEHLVGKPGPTKAPRGQKLRDAIEQLEREMIAGALEAHEGNRTRVAAELGLSRLGLRKKLTRLGLG